MPAQPYNFTFNEYYGEISSFASTMEMPSGSNELWHWPYNIGKGFLYAVKLRPGLVLAIIDHYTESEIALSFNEKDTAIEFSFVLSGEGAISMADTLHNRHDFSCRHSKAYLSFSSGISGTLVIPKFSYRVVNIMVEPWLFREFVPKETPLAALIDRALCDPFSFPSFVSSFPFTPLINIRLHEIIDCPFDGCSKRYFLESKVLRFYCWQ